MARVLDWLNAPSETDPVIKAAVAHFWFVTIHPFEDGNGHIVRAIADLALARSEGTPHRYYSMSAQIQKEVSDGCRARAFQLDESKFHGRRSSIWPLGCPEAMASRVALR